VVALLPANVTECRRAKSGGHKGRPYSVMIWSMLPTHSPCREPRRSPARKLLADAPLPSALAAVSGAA